VVRHRSWSRVTTQSKKGKEKEVQMQVEVEGESQSMITGGKLGK